MPKDKGEWEKLDKKIDHYSDLALPYVSVIIPSLNCAHAIALTLDSLISQNYPELEIVIIDGGSVDHTLKVIRNYHLSAIRVHSVKSDHPYEMINRGISLASGTYLNFLFPGDFYIRKDALRWIMSVALDKNSPHLVYSAALLQFKSLEPRRVYRDFTTDNIRKGYRPSIIQACWFRSDVFKEIEKFNTHYKIRSELDMYCRILEGSFTIASTSLTLVHFDMRSKTTGYLILNFLETLEIIYRRFGVIATVRWWVRQREFFRLVRFWLWNLRIAIVGR